MIFIGLGANLPSEHFASPKETLEGALLELAARGVEIKRRARWYKSAPVPVSDQPWYINGVAEVATELDAPALLDLLHQVETHFGRVRSEKNAPRVLDLDLLAFGTHVSAQNAPGTIPHPRMHERAFVLLPLAELAPQWHHPVLDMPISQLIDAIPAGQQTELLD